MNINATLIGELIAFTVFVIFCMKYVWPPLNDAIETRQKKIADGLEAADKATKELESAQTDISSQLDDAKKAAAEIIDQANKRKSQILEESQTEAKAERQKILDQGLVEVETERSRARDELRKQVAVLAVAGAEKILERTIDKNAHQDILDDITAKL